MRSPIPALTAFLLSATTAWSETAPVASFSCADQYYEVRQDVGPDVGPLEPFGLHRLRYDGRRMVLAQTPTRRARGPQDLCAEVAAICGGAGLTLASARPVAPSCLRPR